MSKCNVKGLSICSFLPPHSYSGCFGLVNIMWREIQTLHFPLPLLSTPSHLFPMYLLTCNPPVHACDQSRPHSNTDPLHCLLEMAHFCAGLKVLCTIYLLQFIFLPCSVHALALLICLGQLLFLVSQHINLAFTFCCILNPYNLCPCLYVLNK